MRQTRSPFGIERQLTPELFDHYVAKARAERAKAIAEFGGWVGRQLRGVAVRIGARPVRPAPVARKLPG